MSYLLCCPLTHWGWVTHICISELTSIASDNGLSPGRCQAIIWNIDAVMLIGPLGTNCSEILIKLRKYISECRLRNGNHFISASMCQSIPHKNFNHCSLLCSPMPEKYIQYHDMELYWLIFGTKSSNNPLEWRGYLQSEGFSILLCHVTGIGIPTIKDKTVSCLSYLYNRNPETRYVW